MGNEKIEKKKDKGERKRVRKGVGNLVWVGLASSFNDILTFEGYLMEKLSL